MAYLLDTSILARLANSADAQHATAANAVLVLHRRGESLHITPQVLVEFRNVATRSTALNGLGLSIEETETQAAGFEAAFPLLSETPDIYNAWKAIVADCAIIGKRVHDARLVAICHVHHVANLLTFDVSHFTRMEASDPGIRVVEPMNV